VVSTCMRGAGSGLPWMGAVVSTCMRGRGAGRGRDAHRLELASGLELSQVANVDRDVRRVAVDPRMSQHGLCGRPLGRVDCEASLDEILRAGRFARHAAGDGVPPRGGEVVPDEGCNQRPSEKPSERPEREEYLAVNENSSL